MFKRRAKSRLKATRKAEKAENKRLTLLKRYFRTVPVMCYDGSGFNIYLKR